MILKKEVAVVSEKYCKECPDKKIIKLSWFSEESLFSNFCNITEMLEHYEKAAKALDIDIDKIWLDLVRSLVREEAL